MAEDLRPMGGIALDALIHTGRRSLTQPGEALLLLSTPLSWMTDVMKRAVCPKSDARGKLERRREG
jgi:hypothetical protein